MRTRRVVGLVLLLVLLMVSTAAPARASIPSGTQIVLIFVGVAVIGAAIGVGVYYAVRKSPSITGCVAGGAAGFSLVTEGDRESFFLAGDTAGLKAGERVRLKGSKKKDAGGGRRFVVEKLAKDFGGCAVTP